MKKTLLICVILSNLILTIQSQPVQTFALSDVRLLDSPFKEAEETDLRYILELISDRLLAPFLIDAGVEPKAKGYENWESSGLNGHTAGHYLTALALMYASTGNQEVNKRLCYMVDELAKCQQKNGNGYVGGIPDGKKMWEEVSKGNIKADNFSINKRWVPWYNIHKLYAGLRDAWLYAGNKQAKDVLIKLSDWSLTLTASLSDDQMQNMLRCEHGGMNEVLADVSIITGDKKYLDLAKRFSHKSILDPLLQHQDKLNGLHANTQIPKIIGFERIAELNGDTTWSGAAAFFWETVVKNRSVSIGGNSVKEHFNPSNNFSTMIGVKEGPESCNTYNMLKLSKELYTSTSSLKYIDFYERALYNHILSTQLPDHGGFVYFTPMRPQHYRVYSQPQEDFWCCVGSGIENHGKYGELIYAHNQTDLFVNLFIPSQLTWKEKGIHLTQETKFPDSEKTTVKLTLDKPAKFTLNLRYPIWVKAGKLRVMVNGKNSEVTTAPANYISLNRKWKTGDVVTLELPMETTAEFLPDGSPWVSFLHGPIVLAAKTDTSDLTGLFADNSRMGHIANGPLRPLEDAPMIVTDKKDFAAELKPIAGKSLTFSASDIIAPASFKNLELIPFFRLHSSRYMIYWEVTTQANLDSQKIEIRQKESAKIALEIQTIDQVAPGEQQPESDHNFKSENSETGVHMDRHWRHASGWFSYDLKDRKKEAVTLQITYYGMDNNRNFDILLNDALLATQELKGDKGNEFYTIDYPIPADIVKNATNGILTLKFAAKPGALAGGIYYIRLMRKK